MSRYIRATMSERWLQSADSRRTRKKCTASSCIYYAVLARCWYDCPLSVHYDTRSHTSSPPPSTTPPVIALAWRHVAKLLHHRPLFITGRCGYMQFNQYEKSTTIKTDHVARIFRTVCRNNCSLGLSALFLICQLIFGVHCRWTFYN